MAPKCVHKCASSFRAPPTSKTGEVAERGEVANIGE